jgi:hypothetical protein
MFRRIGSEPLVNLLILLWRFMVKPDSVTASQPSTQGRLTDGRLHCHPNVHPPDGRDRLLSFFELPWRAA